MARVRYNIIFFHVYLEVRRRLSERVRYVLVVYVSIPQVVLQECDIKESSNNPMHA